MVFMICEAHETSSNWRSVLF